MTAEKPINWKAWATAPVLLWEAAALVVGIDPRRLQVSSDNWTAPGGRSPMFERRSFPSPEARARFDEALAHADRATTWDGPIHLIDSHRGCTVSLREVVEFFLACGWDGIPAGLVEAVKALAGPQAKSEDADPALVAQTGDEWKPEAVRMAQTIIKERAKADLYPSQEHLADQIAADFRKRGVVGADGKPLSGAYIKRHALKGITSATKKALSTRPQRGK